MFDWKLAIVTNFRWRQAAEDRDAEGLYPMGAPKVAASEEAIARAELEIGVRFPEDYAAFLRHADGWPSFCENMDLFGTRDFLSGEAKRLLDRNAAATAFMHGLGFGRGDYCAVGGDRDADDLFLLISSESRKSPGEVIWYSDEELDRCRSFQEFFSNMIAFNQALAQNAHPDGAGR